MVAIINLFGSGRTTIEGVAEAVEYRIEEKEVDTGSRFVRFMAPNLKNMRTEIRKEPLLTFRVKQFDESGTPSGYTPVMASASSRKELHDSFIAEGDEVRVSGTIDDGLMEADELTNLRTGMTVNV